MITLCAIGVIYALLGIWCTIQARTAAAAVGFELRHDGGLSEFVTVYGGLEVGMGAAMILTSLDPDLRAGGLVFALVVSAALPLFRLPTLLALRVPAGTRVLFAIELALAVLLLIAWLRA